MKSIKDTKNKALKTIENRGVSHISGTLEQTLSRSLADDSQKIVKALYLITDFLSETDVLRSSIRLKSLEVMQFLFDSSRVGGDFTSLKNAHHTLYEVLSYVDIVYRTGFMSEMNYSILVKKIHSLQESIAKEIENRKPQNKESNISLSHLFSAHDDVLDIDKPGTFIPEKTVSIKKTTSAPQLKTVIYKTPKISLKEKRHQNILDILKQKKDASINDVCSLFKDCSSKTIQRDLKDLIKNKKVVKRGDRRWAVYNLK